MPTAIGMVRAGLGLTVLPRSGLAAHGGDASGAGPLVGVALRNPAVARTLGLVARRDGPLSPHAALLAELITERFRATQSRAGRPSRLAAGAAGG